MKEQSTETGASQGRLGRPGGLRPARGAGLVAADAGGRGGGDAGSARYARRRASMRPPGYRNGYGKPRRLSLSVGTITLRRPRVRGLEERFESRLLPLFKRRTEAVGQLLPQLYLHGLAPGDFDLALRGLLGDGAPLSAASVARLKAGWQAEYELWGSGSLADLEPVFLWVDGIYVKAGLEKDKAAMLVVLAGLRDGRKVILAVESGYRESTESWAAVLRDLQRRGLRAPRLRGRRRPPRDLGRAGGGLPDVRRAAVLEPPARERAGQAAEEAPGRGAGVCSRRFPTRRRGRRPSGRSGRSRPGRRRRASPAVGRALDGGLGAAGDLLRSSRRRTGSTCGPRTRSSRRSPRCGCGRRRPSGSSGWRTRPPSSGRRCWSRSRPSGGSTRPSCWRKSPRGSTYVNGVREKRRQRQKAAA